MIRHPQSNGGKVAVLIVCGLVACQTSGETTRAELKVQQASWGRQIESLKAQHAALRQRFGQRGGELQRAGGADASQARARAIVDGVGQSLVDVEIQMRQVGGRVDEAIGRGGEAAERALAEERARMSGYIEALAADLGSAGKQLDGLGEQGGGGGGADNR